MNNITFILGGLMLTASIIAGCEKKTECVIESQDLIGTWADTLRMVERGIYIDELTLHGNGTFTMITNSYGIYEDQKDTDLSGWHIRYGKFVQEENRLSFISEKAVAWDSFEGGNPTTIAEEQTIFENCTFTLTGDRLELAYTTFPADAPVTTFRIFHRKK